MIVARRKDGSRAGIGDGVFIRKDDGTTTYGWIRQVTGTMRFRSLGGRCYQTYRVYCKDGAIRPVHAGQIKKTTPSKRSL